MSNEKMQAIKQYALGRQDMSEYKKRLGIKIRVGRHKNRKPMSWVNIDWAKPINDMLVKFRRKALGKIKNRSFVKKVGNP